MRRGSRQHKIYNYTIIIIIIITGNYRDAAGRRDMRLWIRDILRSTADDHRSNRTTARLRVDRLLNLRVS